MPTGNLQAASLAKRYGEETALEGITFSVTEGEVLGIVGPNGAGKTTLLEVLVGLTAADSGNVMWRGRKLPLRRRKEVMFYLPDGVRPYQDRFALDVVSFLSIGIPAVITGFALGLIEGLTKVVYPEASSTVIFLVMIVVLLTRPSGLFGKEA